MVSYRLLDTSSQNVAVQACAYAGENVCFLKFAHGMLFAKKADASAVKPYIRIQSPIHNTSMAPNPASVKVPQTDVAQVFHSQLQDFLHDYVMNCATEPHEFYTPLMCRDDTIRAHAFDNCQVSVFLCLMGSDSERLYHDPTKISRFGVMSVPMDLLDSITGIQAHENESFLRIVQMPVQAIARNDTLREWARRQAKWQEYHQRAEVDESKFHTHLKESTDFLRQLQQVVDGSHHDFLRDRKET